MRDITVERAPSAPGNYPLLAEQIDTLLSDISREFARRASEGQSLATMDAWLARARERFWDRQFELIDESDYFWFRMAAPASVGNRIHAAIVDNEVEVRSESNALIRRVPLRSRVDETTVSVLFDGGYFHMTGAKLAERAARRTGAERVAFS